VRRLFQHGSKAEKLSRGWFLNDDFLAFLVERRHTYQTGNQYIGLAARCSPLVDAFARRESLEFHLAGQHCSFIVVQQREERDALQKFWIAVHGCLHARGIGIAPRPLEG
jgi:hypothetical protein